MICSACLDFHHAQLYQPSSLFSTRSLQNAERINFIKFQLSFQPETFATTPTLAKGALNFNLKLSIREARQFFLSTSLGFPRNFCRVRLPTQFIKIQNATLDTRSAATFESDNAREKQSRQFQRILSGASDLSLPTRNAERLR